MEEHLLCLFVTNANSLSSRLISEGRWCPADILTTGLGPGSGLKLGWLELFGHDAFEVVLEVFNGFKWLWQSKREDHLTASPQLHLACNIGLPMHLCFPRDLPSNIPAGHSRDHFTEPQDTTSCRCIKETHITGRRFFSWKLTFARGSQEGGAHTNKAWNGDGSKRKLLETIVFGNIFPFTNKVFGAIIDPLSPAPSILQSVLLCGDSEAPLSKQCCPPAPAEHSAVASVATKKTSHEQQIQ